MIFGIKAKYLWMGLIALVLGGALVSTLAVASEIEAPFWKVNEKRLEVGEKQQAKVKEHKESKEEETIIKSELPIEKTEKKAETEIRCKTVVSKNAELKGSKPKEDAGFNVGIGMTGCKLWAKNWKELVEEKACTLEAAPGEELLGRFWLEGTVAEGKTAIVLLLKATKIAVFKITGVGCRFLGEYTLGGSVAVQVTPENAENKNVKFIFPSPPITAVHQAQPAKEEAKPQLTLGSTTAAATGELETVLENGQKFGAFAPEGEAPFWIVNEKRLGLEEKQAAKTVGTLLKKEGKETIIKSELPIEKTETKAAVEIRCKTVVSKNAELKGSKPKSDAGFGLGLAITSCKLWAKNGKELVEEKECTVEAIPGEELAGRFWLEGTTAEEKTVVALLLKAASMAVFKITGAGCRFAGEYTLSGNVAVQVSPENAENKAVRLIFPSPPIPVVHQAQPAVEEEKLELKLGGSKAAITSEMETELESGLKFGAFE